LSRTSRLSASWRIARRIKRKVFNKLTKSALAKIIWLIHNQFMPTEGGQEGSPMPAERIDQPPKTGILSRLTSILGRISGRVEQTAVKATKAGVDPSRINPFSKEPPQSPPTQTPSSEPGQP